MTIGDMYLRATEGVDDLVLVAQSKPLVAVELVPLESPDTLPRTEPGRPIEGTL